MAVWWFGGMSERGAMGMSLIFIKVEVECG